VSRAAPGSGEPGVGYDPGLVPQSDDFILAFRRLQGEMDHWFVELCAGSRLGRAPAVRALADVYLTADPPTITVELDVAAVEPEDIDVQLDGDLLVVRGVRRRASGERRVYQHAEIDWGVFERRVRLGVPVDAEAVRATYDRGLLTIALPLGARTPSERIAIAVHGGAGAS
jgi:HSP20 family protein